MRPTHASSATGRAGGIARACAPDFTPEGERTWAAGNIASPPRWSLNKVSTGLSAAQVLPALVGAALGIAGGLALFAASGGGGDGVTGPPLWQLLAVVPVTMLVLAVLTTIPARVGAHRPAAQTLQAELA